jgi:hypothetical protein
MDASHPLIVLGGPVAKKPLSSLKTLKAAQFSERAHAIIQITKQKGKIKVDRSPAMIFAPGREHAVANGVSHEVNGDRGYFPRITLIEPKTRDGGLDASRRKRRAI